MYMISHIINNINDNINDIIHLTVFWLDGELESNLLTPCHALIRKQLHQHLQYFALDKSDILKSIPFLPHIHDFDVIVLDCLHQALVHIMVRVDLVCIKIWMVYNPLYKIFQVSCVDIVSKDMVLKNSRRRWLHPRPVVASLLPVLPPA
jgi:hypothetical protein